MKIAVIQLNAGENKEQNIAKAARMVLRAVKNNAQAVFLPEVFNYRGPLKKQDLAAVAENIPGPSLRPLMELAKEHRVFILAGSLYEKVTGSAKCYNTSVLINDYGRVSAKYRKTHLFEAVINDRIIKERQFFLAGRSGAIAMVDSLRLGMAVCYDLRFADQFAYYRKRKCQVVSLPSNFTYETGKAHWEVLLRARAIENLSYVVAPNQCGTSSTGIRAYGNSMVVGPWGQILARASTDKEEIIYARLQREALEYSRAILPTTLQ